MAENLASRDGLPVLDLVVGRAVKAPEFSFSWLEGGAGGGGRGGRAGRGGGAAIGSLSDGGGGARRFLLLSGVEFVLGLGLERGVEVLLWDTTKECDPSKRVDQSGASFLSSQPMRKLPSVSSILLWMISVILSNFPGELIPVRKHENTFF